MPPCALSVLVTLCLARPVLCREPVAVTPFYSIRNVANSPFQSTARTPPQPTSTTTTTSTTPPTASHSPIEVLSFCNSPGRAPRSQLSPVQLTYLENDQVQYTCDEYISLKQYRKCVRGQWEGDTPICGKRSGLGPF